MSVFQHFFYFPPPPLLVKMSSSADLVFVLVSNTLAMLHTSIDLELNFSLGTTHEMFLIRLFSTHCLPVQKSDRKQKQEDIYT